MVPVGKYSMTFVTAPKETIHHGQQFLPLVALCACTKGNYIKGKRKLHHWQQLLYFVHSTCTIHYTRQKF